MREIYFMFYKQSGNSEICLSAVLSCPVHRNWYADQCTCVVLASLVNAMPQSEKNYVSNMNHLHMDLCKTGRCQWQTFTRPFKLPGSCIKGQEELRKILYLNIVKLIN